MSITYPDWTPHAPKDRQDDLAAPRTGMGALLAERGVKQRRSLRERAPSIAISVLAHGAIAWGLLAVSMTAIKKVEEATINVSIATTEAPRPEPPLPRPERLPDIPGNMPQIAMPQIEIAAAPSPMAIQAAPASPPPQPSQPEKPAEEAPVSPPRFDAAYLNNPQPVYPNMSRRLRETGLVQLRVRVSALGLPLEVQINKSSGYARLDEAAMAAVKQYKFQPAMRSGSAVEAWVLVPFDFSLSR